MQRPVNIPWPYLSPNSPLYQELLFAGLGPHPGGEVFHDCSPYAKHGLLTGYTGAGDSPLERWRYDRYLGRNVLGFDGSNDYVITGNVTTDASIVFSSWVYPTATTRRTIFGRNNTANLINIEHSGNAAGDITFMVPGEFLAYTGNVVPANTWTHVMAVVYGNRNYACFINGIVTSITIYNTNTTATAGAGPITLGARSASQFFAGVLCDTLLFNRTSAVSAIPSLANPLNGMLEYGGSSLILPPRRQLIAVGAGAAPSGHPAIRRFGGVPFAAANLGVW